MWTLPRPNIDAATAYATCVNGVQNVLLKLRLTSFAAVVQASATAFGQAAAAAQSFSLRPAALGGAVTKEELTDVYTLRMAKKESRGRPIYDQLLMAVPLGICPLCGQRIVTTIDHYLPKSSFPELCVTPDNLVPACSDCNKLKGDKVAVRFEDQPLHPYFDNLEQYEPWLYVDLIQAPQLALRFVARPPANWPIEWQRRVSSHFAVFGLGTLYGSHAAQELVHIKYHLELLHRVGGATAVQTHLSATFASRVAVKKNSWQTAMYRVLATDQWFHKRGFSVIAL